MPNTASARNVRSVAAIESQALAERTPFERATDAVARLAGTGAFIALHVVIFAGWIALNTGQFGLEPFDPFPYSLLTLAVSLEAILLTAFILRAQTVMARRTDLRENLDLQINLLAEQEATAMLRMLKALCRAHDIDISRSDGVDSLLEHVDVRSLANNVRKVVDGEGTTLSSPAEARKHGSAENTGFTTRRKKRRTKRTEPSPTR